MVATTPWPAMDAVTFPGVGISLGVSRLLVPLLATGTSRGIAVGAHLRPGGGER